MTSLAIKTITRTLPVRASRPRAQSYLSAPRPSVVDPYLADAAHERGLAAAIVGAWPLASDGHRSLD
jgi:hypothetical protein